MTRGTRAAPTAPVAPIAIGPDSAIAVLGVSWREALSLARALGVAVVTVGERTVIPARPMLDAIERRATPAAAELDSEALVLARLGRTA